MTNVRGRAAVLMAFDRLFERAARKLNFACTAEEREAAKRSFTERYQQALALVDQADLPAIPEPTLADMDSAIDALSPAFIAAHIATLPLAVHVQESMRQVALRAAEQRLLHHLATQADDGYGGN
jgi:hypothetical protein